MNIIITGATGFIGKKLVQALMPYHNIHILVRQNTQWGELGVNHIFEFSDNIEQLASYMKENEIEGIVHLASLFLAQHNSENIKEIVLSNIYLGTALLEAAKNANVQWFLNTGSYWQNYHCDSEKYCPVNLYAASKEAFINMAKYYTETSNLNFVTLKICDTYGNGDVRPKIMTLFKRLSESGETLAMSPGDQLLDILHIDDVVSGFSRLILQLGSNKISESEYVLRAEKRYSLKEIATIFSKISGKNLNIVWSGLPYRSREVMIPWKKGILVPGWEPTIDIESGIKLMLNIL